MKFETILTPEMMVNYIRQGAWEQATVTFLTTCYGAYRPAGGYRLQCAKARQPAGTGGQ